MCKVYVLTKLLLGIMYHLHSEHVFISIIWFMNKNFKRSNRYVVHFYMMFSLISHLNSRERGINNFLSSLKKKDE